MRIYRADLRLDDKVRFLNGEQIESLIQVNSIFRGGDLEFYCEDYVGKRILKSTNLLPCEESLRINRGIKIYNYGNRNHGRRVHIKFELSRNYTYEIKKGVQSLCGLNCTPGGPSFSPILSTLFTM